MLLIAVSTWLQDIMDLHGKLELLGDALGILKAILARRARCPTINKVIMELQLLLGRTMFDMQAAHLWSEKNIIADALSRLPEGAALPPDCAAAVESEAKRPVFHFLGAF